MKTDIRKLDLQLLLILDSLLETKSVTKTAQHLALTQPAISGGLKRLRELFDDELFLRAQRGLIATNRALELVEPLKKLLRDTENLFTTDSFDPSKSEQLVRIAATDYAQKVFLSPFIGVLKDMAPRARIEIHPLRPHEVAHDLGSGKVDFIFSRDDWSAPHLYRRAIARETFACAIATRFAEQVPQTLESFAKMDHVLLSLSGGRGPTRIDDALKARKLKRHISLTLPNFLLLEDILQYSPSIAVAPQRLLQSMNRQLTIFPCPIDIGFFDIQLVWHGRTHNAPAFQWFRKEIGEFCQSR
ncbi:MAG: LysR family transcriptional regulator [Pseudobacteriovorax sp.]|nr:LysR family transcriptional regulator [Pseudobacteriovorax sp.]